MTLPFGGHIHIGYEQTTPSYDLPGRRWVMSSVETTGGYKENGAVRSKNTFEYSGGYRDRRERDFYGFKQVRTNQIEIQRTVIDSIVTPYRLMVRTGITMRMGLLRVNISIPLMERNCRDLYMTTT